MSDFSPKPVNPTGNLGNTNASIAIANKGQASASAIRVVVSELNTKQVVLTNPNNQQSVAIPLAQFSNKNSLRLGQNFALVLKGKEQTSQQIRSEIPNSRISKGQVTTYLLTPLNSSSLSSNTNALAQLSLQNQKLSLPLSAKQANALLNSASKLTASPSVEQKLIQIQASVKSIIGNQVILQLPAIDAVAASEVKVTLPNQIAAQLKIGQSLGITAQISNDKVKVLSIALLIDKSSNARQTAINRLFSDLSPKLLDKIDLPTIYVKSALTKEQLAGNQLNTNVGANRQVSVAKTGSTELLIDRRLLDRLPPADSKQLKTQIIDRLNTTEQAIERGISAQVENKQGRYYLSLEQKPNLIQLTDKQAALLLPSTTIKTPATKSDQVDLNLSNARENVGNQALKNGLYTPGSIVAAAKHTQVTSSQIATTEISNTIDSAQIKPKDTVDSGISREMRISNFLSQSAVRSTLSANEIQNLISKVAKHILPKTSEQTLSYTNIINALNDTESWSPDLQKLLAEVKDKLPKIDTQASLNDANTLRQLLALPMTVSPLNTTTGISQNGFLNALVTLLQVSLASRLQKQSNQHASKVQQAMPDLIKQLIPTLSPAQGAKLSQEFNQFDAKHMLSAEVSKLLANHQQHKLKSADSSIQGQDSLFYSFPNLFYKQGKDIELSIKREFDENEQTNNDSEKQKRWSLSMKFEIGESGEMLAKTLLIENKIDLQIYTSNEELKIMVLEYLPLLKERLSSLGIDLINKGCQLGKIPKTLDSAHFSVFETDA